MHDRIWPETLKEKERVDSAIRMKCILNKNKGSCGQNSHCSEHELGNSLLYTAVDSLVKNACFYLTS